MSVVIVVVYSSHLFLSISIMSTTINSKFQFLYVVMDIIAGSMSGPIIMLASDPVAVRSFSDAVRGPNSILCAHPDDYKLVRVGSINSDTGELIPCEPIDIITARTVVDLSNREDSSNG